MVLLKIIYAFASVAGLGIFIGVVLGFASKALAVKKDERTAAVEAALPGLNCGACGYAGCSAYAAAIASGEAELTRCSPGGETSARKLAAIMGQEFNGTMERNVTQVFCRGGAESSTYAFAYRGIRDCSALYSFYGGNKTCKSGCLGQGSCIRVCPVDAIAYDDQGLVWVDREACISCGKCIEVCPTKVMRWVPHGADLIVACNSTDKGAAKRKYCKVSCIGCKLCEKKSPEGGYKVEDNLCRIDYKANGDRRAGQEACPTHCIIENKARPKAV